MFSLSDTIEKLLESLYGSWYFIAGLDPGYLVSLGCVSSLEISSHWCAASSPPAQQEERADPAAVPGFHQNWSPWNAGAETGCICIKIQQSSEVFAPAQLPHALLTRVFPGASPKNSEAPDSSGIAGKREQVD